MSETKYTPGPWVADGEVIETHTAMDGDVAACGRGLVWAPIADPEVRIANARLIAAAPDLLAMLQRIERDSGAIFDSAGNDYLIEVQGLIAKATGGDA